VRDKDNLLSVAHEAADLARRILRSRTADTVAFKAERDPVTDVDLYVEQSVRELLKRHAPEIGFHGEETASHTLDDDLSWVLDPIDGTANFMHGIPLVAVSLALVRRGVTEVAVIDLPMLDARYHAVLGRGAERDGQTIHASGCSRLPDAIVSIGDYATGQGSAERNAPRHKLTSDLAAQAQRVRMLGTAAIDLVWVAEGLLDASVMLSNKPWDTAAGVLIAREAGAAVNDADGRPHTLSSTATVASAPGLAAELHRLISHR
jgi:myo-inositol-1(or 4)-monophosphatase